MSNVQKVPDHFSVTDRIGEQLRTTLRSYPGAFGYPAERYHFIRVPSSTVNGFGLWYQNHGRKAGFDRHGKRTGKGGETPATGL